MWGYEFASVGYGTLRIGVLTETGDVMPHLDEPSRAGSVGGGAEFALGPGKFRLGIDAGEDARYALLVCGGAETGGGDRGSIDRRSGSRGRFR